jgi:hypothetical protein
VTLDFPGRRGSRTLAGSAVRRPRRWRDAWPAWAVGLVYALGLGVAVGSAIGGTALAFMICGIWGFAAAAGLILVTLVWLFLWFCVSSERVGRPRVR